MPWPPVYVEAKVKLALAQSQREALHLAVGSKVLVRTDGLGVGRTSLVNSILRVLAAKGVRIALAAPTGRAAKRLRRGRSWPGRDVAGRRRARR